ncbi:MAG: nuclear transport factor 2 family protein [Acidobacteriota bacterium]
MPLVRATRFSLIVCTAALLVTPGLSALAGQQKRGMPRAERHEIRHEIDHLEDLWQEAVLHRNVQALDNLLADDYTAITANGTLQSKEQTLENLRDGAVRFNSIEVTDRKVRFYGHTALVTSKAVVQGTTPEGELSGDYRYTRVYVRDAHGNWKIVSFEVSQIRTPDEQH